MILADVPEMKDLPHEYKLSVTNQKVSNTYVFSEENLTRFRDGKEHTTNESSTGNEKNGSGQSHESGYQAKRKRYQPYRRVNIPSMTRVGF